MSFTDGKPWTASKQDCQLPWHGGFRCKLCGKKFVAGDIVRWQYTNDTAGAGGNPLVCVKCDGTKEAIIERMKLVNGDKYAILAALAAKDTEIARLRHALLHHREALIIVRDRQAGCSGIIDLTKGINQINDALFPPPDTAPFGAAPSNTDPARAVDLRNGSDG
jgi:hypothetical protein